MQSEQNANGDHLSTIQTKSKESFQTQLQTESELVVNTERLLAGRKDKTKRLAAQGASQDQELIKVVMNNTQNPTQMSVQLATSRVASTMAIRHPSQLERNITPGLSCISELDRSGSLANFQSAEPVYRHQESSLTNPETRGATVVSNFRVAAASQNQNAGPYLTQHQHEEQGCQMVSMSSQTFQNYANASAQIPATITSIDTSGGVSIQQEEAKAADTQSQTFLADAKIANQDYLAHTGASHAQNLNRLNQNERRKSCELIPAEASGSPKKHKTKISPSKLTFSPEEKQNLVQSVVTHHSLLDSSNVNFGLKKYSQAASQNVVMLRQPKPLQNSVFLSSHQIQKPQKSHRLASQFLKNNKSDFTAKGTSSSPRKITGASKLLQRRSQQRNQIEQRYGSSRSNMNKSHSAQTMTKVINAQNSHAPKKSVELKDHQNKLKSVFGNNIQQKRRSFDGSQMQLMLMASSRSGALNQSTNPSASSTNIGLSHVRSHQQFKKLASYPKRMLLAMNKVSDRPNTAVRKGHVQLNDIKEEEFFKAVRPLVSGAKFCVAMDSGTNVEQIVYLNLDLESLHIESADHSTCAEIISVRQLYKTELPPATLEQMRIFQRSPQEVAAQVNQGFEFSLHVLEVSSWGSDSYSGCQISTIQQHPYEAQHMSTQVIAGSTSQRSSPTKQTATTASTLHLQSRQQHDRQYRVKLTATSYEQLKEWIVGLNVLIKEKQNLSRLSALIGFGKDY